MNLRINLKNTKIRIFIFKVRYSDETFVINPCKDTLDQKALMFLVKTCKWAYENEWRIVFFDGSGKKEPLKKHCIKNIYIGKDASKENIESSIEIIKTSNPGIGLLKSTQKNNTLTFEKIN